MLWIKKEVDVGSKEEQEDVEDDPDEEDMDNANLENERERHWRMVFEDNDGGVDDANALLHAKMWDVYVNEKEKIFKCGYSVEVVGYDKKKFLYEVVDNNFVEDPRRLTLAVRRSRRTWRMILTRRIWTTPI